MAREKKRKRGVQKGHPGAAAVTPAVVHARRAFGLQFFPQLPTEAFFPLPTALQPLEYQLSFRRDWLPFYFGNVHRRVG